MSCRKAISSIDADDLALVENECAFTPEASTHEPHPARVKLYYTASSNSNILILPFYFAQKLFGKWPNGRRVHSPMGSQVRMTRQPRNEDQTKIIAKSEKILANIHSLIIAVHCGFGKTFIALYLACKLGLKTTVLVHLVNNMTQMKNEILESVPNAKVQILSTKTELDPDADFYIVNPMICTKLGQKYEDPFAFVGTLIVDECHLICAEKMSMSMTQFAPKYLIGLSATPTRKDGKDRVLDVYFGPVRLYKAMSTKFIVNRYKTGFVPEKKYDKRGKLIWSSVLQSIAENTERNELIAELVTTGPLKKRNTMILCKTKAHCKVLSDMLDGSDKFKGGCTRLWGSTKLESIDRNARVLIGTYSKCGVGFDHPKMNTMVLAADTIEIEQFAGRIFRQNHDEVPIIYDIVDSMSTLEKHSGGRNKWYVSRGAEIVYNPTWKPNRDETI